MRNKLLFITAGFVLTLGVALWGPFTLMTTKEIVIRAGVYDVAPLLTDLHNWKLWYPEASEHRFVVTAGNPAAVVVKDEKDGYQSLTAVADTNIHYTHVQWRRSVSLAEWMGGALAMKKDLNTLKRLCEDPAGYYGFSLVIRPVMDTLMLTKQALVAVGQRFRVQSELLRDLRIYLAAHSAVKGVDYFFVGADRVGKDSLRLSVGIPVAGQAPETDNIQYLHLPAAGRLLIGSFTGSYDRMPQLKKVMEKHIADSSLKKVADPFEKWSDDKTYSLIYGIY